MSYSVFPERVEDFRSENPEATIWVLKATGWLEVPPGAEWLPRVVRFNCPRPTIAQWLDLARSKIWHLSRETGWALYFNVDHTESGIGVAAYLLPEDNEFIGPRMDIGAAFLLSEQQHLQHLAEMLSCEALIMRGHP